MGIGIALGTIVALGVSSWHSSRERKTAAPAVEREAEDSATPAQTRRIEAASALLTLAGAMKRAPAPAPASATPNPQRTDIKRPSPEERLAGLRAMDQALLDRQKGESVDREWAPSAEKAIRAGLDQLKVGRKFTVEGAECRTLTCSATIRWANGQNAEGELQSLVQYGYGLNDCARGLTLPKTDFLPGEPVVAPLVFDCTNRRNAAAAPSSSGRRG
jgi:hypothetical protein